jgi:hypothetical protein
MTQHAKTIVAALALLASGSTPWACESSDNVGDEPPGVANRALEPLTSVGAQVNLLEPWYETCGDIGEELPKDPHDDIGNRIRNDSHGRQTGATATFTVPSTAGHAWLAIGYTSTPQCDRAKMYFDDRYIETINLRAPHTPFKCERVYYLENPSAAEHRMDVELEGRSAQSDGGYACLDYVVAGW